MSLLGGMVASPGITLTTASETVLEQIGPFQLTPPPNCSGIVIRGHIVITTGTAVTAINLKLRAGTTVAGAQIGTGEQAAAGASGNWGAPFHFVDANLQNLTQNGYVITGIQVAATGNGNLLQVSYELDYIVP
jgi:hypothetical protein